MRFLLIALLVLAVSACGEVYEEVEALFDTINLSPNPIGVQVAGNNELIFYPNSSAVRFVAKILIAHNRVGYFGGPSTVDKQTTVDAVVRDTVTGDKYGVRCQSGVKLIGVIRYERRGGFGTAYCTPNQSY